MPNLASQEQWQEKSETFTFKNNLTNKSILMRLSTLPVCASPDLMTHHHRREIPDPIRCGHHSIPIYQRMARSMYLNQQ